MLNFLNRVKTQIYNSLEYILIAGLIVLALIFIATSIYVFSLVVILPSNYSLEGLSNLYNYFNVPVKLLAGIFALIAIILTIGRMDQTKKQIEVMTSNNNFNNYFKYQELFKELMLSGTLLNRRGKLSEGIINAVFRDLYGSSPKYFNGKLKSGKEELCKDVFSFFIEVEKKSKKVSNEESDDFRENMRALSQNFPRVNNPKLEESINLTMSFIKVINQIENFLSKEEVKKLEKYIDDVLNEELEKSMKGPHRI